MGKFKIPQHRIYGPGDAIGAGDSRVVYCKRSRMVRKDESECADDIDGVDNGGNGESAAEPAPSDVGEDKPDLDELEDDLDLSDEVRYVQTNPIPKNARIHKP